MNILISFLLLFGFTSKASEIYRISKILADDQRDLIFLNTGEVVESPDESITRIATQSLKEKKGVILKLQKLDDEFRRSIVDIESVEYGEFEPQPEHEFTKFNDERYFRTPLDHYTVHQYRKYEQAQALMNDFRRDTLNSSQCYNRAHVWTYEAFKKYNIYMGKMWIFYTDKYIREFNNKWWFHVAPYIHLKGWTYPVVLDPGFTQKPWTQNTWTNLFMKNKAVCKTVSYYSHYEQNQEQEWCYLIRSSMYYWQPYNIEILEKLKQYKWGYLPEEVDHAYRDAIYGQ